MRRNPYASGFWPLPGPYPSCPSIRNTDLPCIIFSNTTTAMCWCWCWCCWHCWSCCGHETAASMPPLQSSPTTTAASIIIIITTNWAKKKNPHWLPRQPALPCSPSQCRRIQNHNAKPASHARAHAALLRSALPFPCPSLPFPSLAPQKHHIHQTGGCLALV